FFGSTTIEVERNPSFATLNSEDVNRFKEILGEKSVIEDEDSLAIASVDWMRKYKGFSKLLLQPKSTQEVSEILKYCNSRRLAVVPQGGNTGFVSGILVCEAGCILENLDSFLLNEGKGLQLHWFFSPARFPFKVCNDHR
ncbi:D-2-hydroxyglutarate dehydrogenase protein, partial [Thalictrum thalictroides]